MYTETICILGYKMHKRVGDIEEFQFRKLSTDTETGDIHLHITIVISGWLNDDIETSYSQPWKYLRVLIHYILCIYFIKYTL